MSDREKMIPFEPDYVVPPGESLSEILEHQRMTQKDLADRAGRPIKTINEIIKGKSPITPETALQFERVLGTPSSFWNDLEKNYRATLVRLHERAALAKEVKVLEDIPVNVFVKHGWIEKAENKIDQLKVLLNYFSVASPKQLFDLTSQSVAFRKSKKLKADPWLVAGWLRKGQIEAKECECGAFNKDRFLLNLKEIRSLTDKAMSSSLCDKWRSLCFESGVALVFVPEVPKLTVNGATYWIKDKAVIQLSLRYKYSDILWFTFFHEAGHILYHGRKDVFLENKNSDNMEKELEANRFSSNFLISQEDFREFKNDAPITIAKIKNFAKSIGVGADIVVGRLLYEKIVLFNRVANLRSKLRWTKDE